MLLPYLFQVVLLLGEPLVVLESATFAHENTEVHHIVTGFVLHAVDAELVELVFSHLLSQVRNRVRMLLLGQIFRDRYHLHCYFLCVRVDLHRRRSRLGIAWLGHSLLRDRLLRVLRVRYLILRCLLLDWLLKLLRHSSLSRVLGLLILLYLCLLIILLIWGHLLGLITFSHQSLRSHIRRLTGLRILRVGLVLCCVINMWLRLKLT